MPGRDGYELLEGGECLAVTAQFGVLHLYRQQIGGFELSLDRRARAADQRH